MTRYHNIDGKHIKFTLEEEAARDTEENQSLSASLNKFNKEVEIL